MASHQQDVVVNASLSTVIDNFEAFLWADDQRVDPDHEPGTTTAVERVNRTTFEETEKVDLMIAELEVKTRYDLTADPQGTRITVTYDLPDLLEGFLELMGESVDAHAQADGQRWASRLSAYIDLQKQVGGDSTPEVA